MIKNAIVLALLRMRMSAEEIVKEVRGISTDLHGASNSADEREVVSAKNERAIRCRIALKLRVPSCPSRLSSSRRLKPLRKMFPAVLSQA